MRIIAGKYKRRKIMTLAGTDITRPTSDRVKESIFNMLQDEIAGNTILDLFAGSGALGLEAMSRGAKKVIFVEENKGAVECIKANLLSLASDKETFQVYQNRVSDFLNPKNQFQTGKVDLIFADPPYNSDWYYRALSEIEGSGLCNINCMVVLEMSLEVVISEQKNWDRTNTKKYGKTKIELWRYSPL